MHRLGRRLPHHVRKLLRLAREELAAVAALGVAGGGVLAFIEIADDMTEADGVAFDETVLALLRPHPDPADALGPPWLETAMLDLTALGGIAVLVLFAAAVIGFLLIQRKWLSAVMLSVGLGGGVILSEGFKGLFDRDRPPLEVQAVETVNASFPSGHALLSTAFYLTLAVLLAHALPQKRLKAYVLGIGMLLALIVGISRVWLGAHWASDVMAGWCLGAAWAMSCWLVAYAFERWQRRRGGALQDAPAVDNHGAVIGE